MAIDLGDPLPLTVTIRNASGAPENAGSVVLTLTLPDGTTTAPAVTGTSGVYTPTAPVFATLAGRWTTRWVATTPNACTFSDVINVAAADPGAIISLAEARAGLGLAQANTVKDEDLRTYIAAATPVIEDIVGPVLRTTRVETFDGGAPTIALSWHPIISVGNVIESFGSNTQFTLTLQDVFAGSGLDAYGYTVDLGEGVLVRRSLGVASLFAGGVRNVQVTYVSGRTAIGGNILLATRRLIRHLWQSEQQGFRPAMSGSPDKSVGHTPSGFAVPKAVLELCAGDTRVPGIG